MSFTQDELQAFNTILEQRLSAQRRELERTFDQRVNALKVLFEQRLESLQHDVSRVLTLRFAEQQLRLREALDQRLQTQQARVTQTLEQQHERLLQQQQSQMEDMVERALAAQLLAIEQLISHHQEDESSSYEGESAASFRDGLDAQTIEAIEVQTEIPWDDIADMFNRVLDERMAHLNAALQASVQHMEQHVLAQVRGFSQHQEGFSSTQRGADAPPRSMQEVLSGIEQLERIVESMQVAMTANHAFLSNRLFHHQQLPLERAHPHATQSTSTPEPISLAGLQSARIAFSEEAEEPQ